MIQVNLNKIEKWTNKIVECSILLYICKQEKEKTQP
jgi:hypothetical protein